MNNLLLAWVGVMLVGIPISLIMSLVCISDPELKRQPLALWAVCYLLYILLVGAVFAGAAGAAMLMEAFR